MKVLVLNDTRADENPGCQATVSSLVHELSRITSGEVFTRVRGDGYEHYAGLCNGQDAASHDRWQSATQRFALTSDLTRAIDEADLVVANLEGTFHHHTVGALALGGALAIAHDMGKRVWAVNGSVQAIEPWLLSAALAPAEWLAVREPLSWRWLKAQGLDPRSAADLAFLIPTFSRARRAQPQRPRTALYTPGVLASLGHPSFDLKEVSRHFDVLSDCGWTPTFLRMADAEDALAAHLRRAGWPVADNRDLDWRDVGAYLAQFGLVVSGRYHLLLFAAMAGVPATALPSNTWKIDGLIELLGGGIAFANSADELVAILRDTPPQPIDSTIIRACQVRACGSLPANGSACSLSSTGPRCAGRHSLLGRCQTTLFGASSLGRNVAARLRSLAHVELTGFLDNDPAKWGQRHDDLVIAAPTREALAAADVIVITSIHAAQIRDQVIAAGFGQKLIEADALLGQAGGDRLLGSHGDQGDQGAKPFSLPPQTPCDDSPRVGPKRHMTQIARARH